MGTQTVSTAAGHLRLHTSDSMRGQRSAQQTGTLVHVVLERPQAERSPTLVDSLLYQVPDVPVWLQRQIHDRLGITSCRLGVSNYDDEEVPNNTP